MVEEIRTYRCEICKKVYESPNNAFDCEEQHNNGFVIIVHARKLGDKMIIDMDSVNTWADKEDFIVALKETLHLVESQMPEKEAKMTEKEEDVDDITKDIAEAEMETFRQDRD